MAHGLPDHRLAGARDQALQRIERVAALASSNLTMRPVSISPQVEALTNMTVGCAEMLFPAPAGDFFGDQRVGGLGVGNAQQRFREAHQNDALVAGKPVLPHEGIDAGVLGMIGAGDLDEATGDLGGAPPFVLGVDGALDEAANETLLVDQVIRGDLFAAG